MALPVPPAKEENCRDGFVGNITRPATPDEDGSGYIRRRGSSVPGILAPSEALTIVELAMRTSKLIFKI